MNLENLNQRLLEVASRLESNNEWHRNLNEKLLSFPQKGEAITDGNPETSSGLIDDLSKVTNWLESLVDTQRGNISRTEDIIKSSHDQPIAG